VFFGHYTVTIPPIGLIDIAHLHGVKVLGTLIFEWEAGSIQAKIMLEGKVLCHTEFPKMAKDSTDDNRLYARKLAEVAHFYGFDGYLMNFECKIDKPDVLLEWLRILKDELHSLIPHSLLIWYDSVLQEDGQLLW
jgi:mannosyl-glycoprotein endo-beta-N-acetylglucosaminidase